MNIYQQIWDADQTGSGVKPILDHQVGDTVQGYVKVAAVANGDKDFKVLPEVHIPESKIRTYQLVLALFDNYALDEKDPENETLQEREEVHNLLSAIVDTAPMQVARRYVEEAIEGSKSEVLKSFGKDNKLVKQLVDLALLANNMLKGEELSKFVKRSVELIKP